MIKPTIEVEINTRGLDEVLEILKRIRADHPTVKAGVLASNPEATAQREGGLNNVQLALVHEYGSPDRGIPERSFVRSTFEAKRSKYVETIKRFLAKGIYNGQRTYLEFLGLIGLRMAADMKARFTDASNGWPANAPSTVAAKGSSRPLIDTGALRASITHEVVPVSAQNEGE